MLILASNSPRRKQLLALGGWEFTVFPGQIDERVREDEHPTDYVRRLAEGKARVVLAQLENALNFEDVIIAADTAVVDRVNSDHKILGKPVDAQEAEAFLLSLRGRTHQVYTALAVLRAGDEMFLSDLCISDVPMRNYSTAEMRTYIASGDPMDKAGAYAIQHAGFRPVERFVGCYANVMGLPVCHLTRLLAHMDIYPETDIAGACRDALDYPCPVFRQILQDL
jgi:septum formation protein